MIKEQIIVIIGVVFFAAASLGLFYQWSYNKGYNKCQTLYAAAALQATEEMADANTKALSKEITDSAKRAVQKSDIDNTIRRSANEDDDSPAPALDQSFYDWLRSNPADGQKAKN